MISFTIETKNDYTNSGTLILERAKVNWYLSIDSENLPNSLKGQSLNTHRVISVDGKEIEFTKGFTDLHTLSYQKIIPILNNRYP